MHVMNMTKHRYKHYLSIKKTLTWIESLNAFLLIPYIKKCYLNIWYNQFKRLIKTFMKYPTFFKKINIDI
jgi:DNA modification methylase